MLKFWLIGVRWGKYIYFLTITSGSKHIGLRPKPTLHHSRVSPFHAPSFSVSSASEVLMTSKCQLKITENRENMSLQPLQPSNPSHFPPIFPILFHPWRCPMPTPPWPWTPTARCTVRSNSPPPGSGRSAAGDTGPSAGRIWGRWSDVFGKKMVKHMVKQVKHTIKKI